MSRPVVTQHAPAERTPHDVILMKRARLADERAFAEVLHRVPDLVMILDRNRQVVFANRAVLGARGVESDESVVGLRPGEVLACSHAGEAEAGCGTTEACRYCGAVNAILASQEGRFAVQECRMLVRRGAAEEAMDLRVWASPIELGGEPYTFLAAVDIADEKRRAFLEGVLLPEVEGKAEAMSGFSSLLAREGQDETTRAEVQRRLTDLSARITDELGAHRLLLAAEAGALKLEPKPLRSVRFLRDVLAAQDREEILNGRRLASAASCDDMSFESDPVVLGRFLEAMITNALEASVPGEAATVGCRADGDGICFWVRSSTYMPESVRRQVFQRSFSTKGPGRGLGTYTMKLLGEKYLGGKVSFLSTERDGTTFFGCFPLECPRRGTR